MPITQPIHFLRTLETNSFKGVVPKAHELRLVSILAHMTPDDRAGIMLKPDMMIRDVEVNEKYLALMVELLFTSNYTEAHLIADAFIRYLSLNRMTNAPYQYPPVMLGMLRAGNMCIALKPVNDEFEKYLPRAIGKMCRDYAGAEILSECSKWLKGQLNEEIVKFLTTEARALAVLEGLQPLERVRAETAGVVQQVTHRVFGMLEPARQVRSLRSALATS
jgi:hypothetical protein